jgi:hypothetical protein
MSYRVLIVVKDAWWSDQKPIQSFADAQRHRRSVANRWNDCDTAILAPDGRVIAFRESLKLQAELEAIRNES